MPKALVTGGAGFIGSNLVTFLLKKGWSVTVIDDLSVGKKENLPKHPQLCLEIADIRKFSKMSRLVKGHSVVFHLATQCVRKSINDPFLVHDVNTSGTLSMLEASVGANIEKFVYVSSSEIYGSALQIPMKETHPLNPTTIYGASKLAGEYYARSYLMTHKLPVVIARPFNTYGYNAHFEGVYGEVIPRFVIRALNGLPMQIFGDGKQTRDFTFVSDTVDGLYKIAKVGTTGEIYNLARGEEVSITKLAQTINSLVKKPVGITYLSDRPGDVRRHFADITRAKERLGFVPQIAISDGLKKYISWFQKNIPDIKKAQKLYEEKNW